jgi:hypothetical protein
VKSGPAKSRGHRRSKKARAFAKLDENNNLTAEELSGLVKGLSKPVAGTYISLYRKSKISSNN